MQRITLPGAPATMPENQAILEFEHEGLYARVKVKLKAGMTDGHIELSMQAFQMTADGGFASAPNGDPSRTSESGHSVNTSSLAISAGLAPTHTLKAGWVRDPGHAGNEVSLENLPEGTVVADALPVTGQFGDKIYVEPFLYVWVDGIVMDIARDKVRELASIVAASGVIAGRGFDLI